jgi:hypothetical protein
MKAMNPALILLLEGGEYVSADLWTLTLNGGLVTRWTSADQDLQANGQTFVSGPPILRGAFPSAAVSRSRPSRPPSLPIAATSSTVSR